MNPINYLLIITVTVTVGCLGQNFDRNWVGVAYSPYTDQLPGRNWDQYSLDDIKSDLRVVRNRFTDISTYSMGAEDYNNGKNWDQCNSNCIVARAAAQVNNEGGQRLSVNIGVFQHPDNPSLQQREINNAFAAAQDANGISGGTVWGITFTNEYFQDYEGGRAEDVLGMINANKNRGFKVGMRTHICGQITGGNLQGFFQRVARESDYIYCNVYPSQEHAQLPPRQAAENVVNYFLYLRSEFQKIRPDFQVYIGETGWPSEGNSFNNSPNTVQNLVAYWNGINEFASRNGVKAQMFQAVDEPWKGAASQWKGESHYGWWTKPTNTNRQLIEKAN